jgi:hypothetical protein
LFLITLPPPDAQHVVTWRVCVVTSKKFQVTSLCCHVKKIVLSRQKFHVTSLCCHVKKIVPSHFQTISHSVMSDTLSSDSSDTDLYSPWKTTMTSGEDVSEYLDTLGLVKSYFSKFFEKQMTKNRGKKCLGTQTSQRGSGDFLFYRITS